MAVEGMGRVMAFPSGFVSYESTNAGLGWVVIGVLGLAAIERAISGELLWAGMAAATIALALVPPAVSRDPREMIAWEVIALAALPVLVRSFGFFLDPAAYLAVAALALVIAVELDAFTSVEMTPEFAVAFVVIVTMAVAGLWAIAQYASDVYLGTSLLAGQTALMWDLIIATGIGIAAGIGFEFYFRRISPGHGIVRDPWGDLDGPG